MGCSHISIMEWRDIIGYEGIYQVSSTGLVRPVKPRRIGKEMMCLSKGRDGYLRVNLTKDGKHKKWPVHRLVATAFIFNPKNRSINNHFNGIRDDNRIENLEWCNHSENNAHAFRVLGRKHSGGLLPKPVISTKNGKDKKYASINEAKLDGFNENQIINCCKKKPKYNTHRGYKWRYA